MLFQSNIYIYTYTYVYQSQGSRDYVGPWARDWNKVACDMRVVVAVRGEEVDLCAKCLANHLADLAKRLAKSASGHS